MCLNFIVAALKLAGGLIFNFSTLLIDSLQSIADFVTDIIAGIAAHVGRKRANKRYPFGYGSIENIANLLTALALVGLGVFAFIHALQPDQVDLSPFVYAIIASALVVKIVVFLILSHGAKRLHNDLLLTGAKETLVDLCSTFVVLAVAICLALAQYWPALQYANTVGGILISLLIFATAGQMFSQNIQHLLGGSDDSADSRKVAQGVQALVNKHTLVKASQVRLQKRGEYYSLHLELRLARELTLRQFFRLQKELRREIKATDYKVRFIEFELKPFHED